MKHPSLKTRRYRESGAALITALMISIALAMLLAASLAVAMTSTGLGYRQVYSQAALQLADAGANNELQFIGLNAAASTVTGLSSQPVVYSGVTAKLPGSSTAVLGRPGTVPGYSGGTFYVFSSNNAAGTTAWDGVTSPYYITCSACVNNVWQTVQITATASSLFNNGGSSIPGGPTPPGTTGGTTNSNPPPAINVVPSPSCTGGTTPCSDVEVTGSCGVNGKVSCSSHCAFHAPQCINRNTGACSTGQFSTSNCSSGGQLCSSYAPITCPKTTDCCKQAFGCSRSTNQPGCSGDNSDATAYATCKSNSCNQTGIYQYNYWANSSTISTRNCTPLQGGIGYSLDNTCFQNCNTKPGTYNSDNWWWGYDNQTTAVQTLIFEPGDYYFTNINLAYQASCEMICDCGALASGGTPGQVRFWVYDANSSTDGKTSDYIQLPITNTCASGESTPDPGKFRIYYAKDGCSCSFTRPSNITDWTGNTRNDDFDYYCGLYSCTKPATDTSCATGTTTTINGTCQQTATPGHGCCNFHGAMVCDHLSCSGACNINFTTSKCTDKDPCGGGQVTGWSCRG